MGRRRVHVTEETVRKAGNVLLSLLPKDGRRVGNLTLLDKFLRESKIELEENFDEDVYWNVRNVLLQEGKLQRGRGKGGSVGLAVDLPRGKKGREQGSRKESALYERFHETIQKEWVQEYDITDYVSEISAHRGRKDAGGKWTIPDVTLVSVDNYPFVPGKSVEVITFEVKPVDSYGVEGVYETASHSAFATKSYLALHIPSGEADKDFLERLEKEAVRFGIGLVSFEDPAEWKTFEVVVEAQHKTPSPRDMNDFLARFREDAKQKLQKLLK